MQINGANSAKSANQSPTCIPARELTFSVDSPGQRFSIRSGAVQRGTGQLSLAGVLLHPPCKSRCNTQASVIMHARKRKRHESATHDQSSSTWKAIALDGNSAERAELVSAVNDA